VSPLGIVASFHLRLKKPSERAIHTPSNSIALYYSALDNHLALQHLVYINPNAFSEDLLSNFVCVNVFQVFWPCGVTPESVAASMRVLLEGSSAHRELRHVFDSLRFLNA